MSATVLEIQENCLKLDRIFDVMGAGLLLIKVQVQPKVDAPFHVLWENRKKPPLDLALNPMNGQISYIKFVLQDELLSTKTNSWSLLDEKTGSPIFDISDFTVNEYQKFYDAEFEQWYHKNEISIEIKGRKIANKIHVGNGVYILVDNMNQFSGIRISELTTIEEACLRKAAVI